MSIKYKDKKKNEAETLGMKVGHIIEDAESWWNTRGREMILHRNESNDMAFQQGNLNTKDPDHPNFVGGISGILLGYPWDGLTLTEQQDVAAVYAAEKRRLIDDICET